MRFDKIIPCERLKPYIQYFVITENEKEESYKVFPSTSLVIGFQYFGQLSIVKDQKKEKLSSAGITGLTDSYKTFNNSANIGTILVYFTEVGIAHFTNLPANELFNQSISLENIFDNNSIYEVQDKLAHPLNDHNRIQVIEQFLLSQLKNIKTDQLIIEAVKMIYQSKGSIRINELNQKLNISQSAFEKRFRKLVGATPKKFASIVRFNSVLDILSSQKSLIEICYENYFFDQAHFIKDFKQYTGDTPEQFKRLL